MDQSVLITIYFDCFKGGFFANLLVYHCSHISIINISFWNHTGYASAAISVTSMLYLDNILLPPKMHQDVSRCNAGVFVCFEPIENLHLENNSSQILISNLVYNGNKPWGNDLCSFTTTMGLKIFLYDPLFDVSVSIINSNFTSIHFLRDPILRIESYIYKFTSIVFIENCCLSFNRQTPVQLTWAVSIRIPSRNANVVFHNVTFTRNSFTGILIKVVIFENDDIESRDNCALVSKVSFIDLTFTHNTLTQLIDCYSDMDYNQFSGCLVNVVVNGFLNIHNSTLFFNGLISIQNIVFHIQGIILISHSDSINFGTIISLDSSIMVVYNKVTFLSNKCHQVIDLISLYPYIVIRDNATIAFKSNECFQLITIQTKRNLNPFCLFQYFTKHVLTARTTLDKAQLLSNLQDSYNIVFIDNIQMQVSNSSKSTINYFTSNCQWLDARGAAFNGYDPGLVNKTY